MIPEGNLLLRNRNRIYASIFNNWRTKIGKVKLCGGYSGLPSTGKVGPFPLFPYFKSLNLKMAKELQNKLGKRKA